MKLKPFGTWSWVSSYSLGGMIGASIGLIMLLPAVGFAAPLALIAAVAIGGASSYLIQASNLAQGDFDKALKKPEVQTITVAEKLLTGAAITGYIALATIAVVDVTKPAIEVNPTPIIESVPMVATDPNITQEVVTEAPIEENSQNSHNISYEDFASIVDNLWLPSGEISSECDGWSDGGECKVRVQGTKNERCSEAVSWYFRLYSSTEEASQFAEENKCNNDLCNKNSFSGFPSGEFEIDITVGESETHFELDAYYQQGPIIADGFMFSCGNSYTAWNFNQSDGIAFITPVRTWLHNLTDK